MRDSYQDGYEAGLNGWPYDLSKITDKLYNAGWAAGYDKRRRWSIVDG